MERERPPTITSAEEPQSVRLRRRQRRYLVMMSVCVTLMLTAWCWVRLWSVPTAVVMSGIAAVIPPTAAIMANWGEDH